MWLPLKSPCLSIVRIAVRLCIRSPLPQCLNTSETQLCIVNITWPGDRELALSSVSRWETTRRTDCLRSGVKRVAEQESEHRSVRS